MPFFIFLFLQLKEKGRTAKKEQKHANDFYTLCVWIKLILSAKTDTLCLYLGFMLSYYINFLGFFVASKKKVWRKIKISMNLVNLVLNIVNFFK